MPATHTDKAFEHDLRTLREKLLAMGAKVEGLIMMSMRALTERDSRLGEQVVEGDAEVNRLEVEIDELCRKILALRQPAASDLRLITTALKIVTDLERIGDLAVNIAERAIDLNQVAPLAPYIDLPKLAELAQQQVKRSLDAFVSADPSKAEEILEGDSHVDSLFQSINAGLEDLKGPKADQSKKVKAALDRTEELLTHLLEVREKLTSEKQASKGRK